MSAHAESSRLAWLSASLATQKHKIMSLLGRIGDLRLIMALKPALFQKFLNLMGQVAVAKDKEMRILSQIEAIEQKHFLSRKAGKLRQAKRAPGKDHLGFDQPHEDCDDYKLYGHTLKSNDDACQPEGELEIDLMAYDNIVTPKRPSYGWLWLIAFWYLMTNKGLNNKKQTLNAD